MDNFVEGSLIVEGSQVAVDSRTVVEEILVELAGSLVVEADSLVVVLNPVVGIGIAVRGLAVQDSLDCTRNVVGKKTIVADLKSVRGNRVCASRFDHRQQ